jgi:glycosyltransferase involved in cell wall biosynthesis
MVDEAVMYGLFQASTVYVHPSSYESLSITVLDAWEGERPVLVNGRCEVTREHCERSGGGLWFDSYASFEVTVDRLVADADLRGRLGAAGKAYVEAHYRWPSLVQRYRAFLESLA